MSESTDQWDFGNVTPEELRRLKYYAKLGSKPVIVGNLLAVADIVRFVAERALSEAEKAEYDEKIDRARSSVDDPLSFVLWCMKLDRGAIK